VTVHVDELHSEVTPVGSPPPPSTTDDQRPSPWAAEDQWQATQRRAEWLQRRTAAECFDD
jgi:hypothetical protein